MKKTQKLTLAATMTKPVPIKLAYPSYMLNVAQNGSLAELISALLPCMLSYWEISNMLANNYLCASTNKIYGKWIKIYSSSEFGSLPTWLIDLLDRLTAGKPARELASLEDHFQTTSFFEYMFWDMVYQGGEWPV